MYDVVEQNYLDVYSIRQVLKKAYTQHMNNLEEAIQLIKMSTVKDDALFQYQDEVRQGRFFDGEDYKKYQTDIKIYDG